MEKKLTFLGIETSCDETAASVVQEKADGTGKILSNIVSSQIEEHKEFGGVVPEIAARAHVEKIEFIIKKAIKESNLDLNNINGISATAGPGLIVLFNCWFKCWKSYCRIFEKTFCSCKSFRGSCIKPKDK